ncbi:MAG: hypothetical protein V7739_18960 [Motiliproteus sp.]
MNKLNLVVISAFAAIVTFSGPLLADPPRVQGPTPSGKSLDQVREQTRTQQREDAKLKEMKRLVAKKYRISETEVERHMQPPKPRPKKVDTGSLRQRSTYGDRFRPFNLPGYVLPDPRRLRPLDR